MDRLAWLTLLCLAATAGLGDIAEFNPVATLVLNTVHALLPLAIVLALCSAVRNRRWPRFPSALALPSAVWLTVLVASAINAAQFQAEAIAALARPASGLLLAWAVCDICGTQTRWRSLIQALALGGLAIASIAIVEATRVQPLATWIAAVHDGEIPIGDVPRVAATLSHPNEAAMYLELCLPLLIASAWTAASRWRVPLALGSLGALLAIAVTFSRAGIVAAVAALAVLGWVGIRRGPRPQVLLLGIVVLALPLAFGWASVMDPGLDHRLLAGLDESSLDQPSRTIFWSTALAMARDHPWLGAGLDNFRWLFPAYSGLSANNLGIHAHDQYLETLADTGILGLASFGWLVTLLVLTAAKGVRHARSEWPWHAALLASLTAWLVHAVLDDFDRFWPTSVAFWLIVGLILCRPLVDRHVDQRLNIQ
ncbi:MAG TPA: O-antigen ligase family protein [Chloroflexota bacterium]